MTKSQALLLLFVGQLGFCAWAHFDGPISISDDDYARVVIAQRWAHHAQLDPSGTSWLPLPFWLNGAAMRLFGASLGVARLSALALALGAAGLSYAAALRFQSSRALAVAAALAPGLLPSVRVLMLATVPEYWTAALVVFGLACLLGQRPDWRGALALAAAALCRYETWAYAAAFAGVAMWMAMGQSKIQRRLALGAAALSCSTMAIWLIHGYFSHGSALFFVSRVQAYKAALGADPRGLLEIALGYPGAWLAREPEAALGLVVAGVLSFTSRSIELKNTRILPGIVAFALVVLVVGDVRGGAPTHHPERALLVPWMLSAPWLLLALTTLPARGAAATALGLCLCSLPLRLRREPSHYVERVDEERVGRLLGERLGVTQGAILATSDFGYFAIQAAAGGDPRRFVVADLHDPRDGVPALPLAQAVVRESERSGLCHVVLPLCIDQDPAVFPLETIGHSADFRLARRSGCTN